MYKGNWKFKKKKKVAYISVYLMTSVYKHSLFQWFYVIGN